jgi:chorismate mutase
MMTNSSVRAIRGAISVNADDPEAIIAGTKRLLGEITVRNAVDMRDIISIFFSVTPDLRSCFPARAAREMGWIHVPMLHLNEIDVVGSLPRIIRVLMHVTTEKSPEEIQHAYLGDARALRPDLLA